MMSAVRATGNKAEVLLRKALWAKGYRYRLYSKALIGRPDIILPRYRVVVFVDGDFWHGRGILQDGLEAFGMTMRTDKKGWWLTKLQRNIERDRRVGHELREQGWSVIRMWESDVNADVKAAVIKVERAIKQRGGRGKRSRIGRSE